MLFGWLWARRTRLHPIGGGPGQAQQLGEAVEDGVSTGSVHIAASPPRPHPELVDNPRSTRLLMALAGLVGAEEADDDARAIARQHLAILDLSRRVCTDRVGVEHAYSVVRDPDIAADTARQAAVDSDARLLRGVPTAASALLSQAFVAPALVVVPNLPEAPLERTEPDERCPRRR